ncbi:hypothetical protein SGM_0299 [Streptomyces griseoaurantiacus M045]|uniref:Uncharacterized protein n=1 Tax=Streptomyces griseoaurantiacus M045 TaxID=996637 RepID=F3NAB5_9ACTN|nr:hypothetical protein SGM_0299 [Streptomyces griseoaurantiacus M045]
MPFRHGGLRRGGGVLRTARGAGVWTTAGPSWPVAQSLRP